MLVDSPVLAGSSSLLIGQAKDKTLTQAGTLAVVTGVTRWTLTNAIRITSIVSRVETPSVGSDIQITVKKNGISVTTSPIVITANTNVNTTLAAAMITNKVTGVAGDYFTADVVQVGSTTSGSDLTVKINYVITGA